jgi:hypothetical protein
LGGSVTKTNKEMKKKVLTAQHRTVRRHSPDSLVHGLRNSALLGFSLATSAIIHRIVRARRWTVRWSSRATAICHVDGSQRSLGAPNSPVPHRKGNQPIRGFSVVYCARTVHCLVRHRTVWCTDEQKARIACQMEFQQLLAALAL